MELTVNTSKSYQIIIERGCIDQIGTRAAGLFKPGSKALIISDTNVAPIYAERVSASLHQAGFTASTFVFPAGEESKRFSSI